MLTTARLARIGAGVAACLTVVAAPWAAVGGLPLMTGAGWHQPAPVTPWIPIILLISLSLSFMFTVWRGSRRSWLWLVPFGVLAALSPVGAGVVFAPGLLVAILSAVLVALPPPAADDPAAA